jgi:hypothetical protein
MLPGTSLICTRASAGYFGKYPPADERQINAEAFEAKEKSADERRSAVTIQGRLQLALMDADRFVTL